MSVKSLNIEYLKLQEEILDKSLSWWEAETLKTVKKSEELEKAAVYRDVGEEQERLEDRMSYLIAKGNFESNQLDLLEVKYNEFHEDYMSRLKKHQKRNPK